ncbi:uncharacterized protein [Spinacia oleracea]|uniref:DDE Tnp4 domain-containing protein n=1 Tax=Spinacia oleracea TaxID=3562 RepID=A0ABM3QQ47_SPIOL|nr:uncharacterized protein LOC110802144 [Spinacia oleracea]
MHWEWKNYPRAWKGMYQGRSKTSTIILEVVASQDLWIWHAFFGTPGSCNDINVLQRLPVFSDICEGRAPDVSFNVNRNTYNMGYYLTDGIYPKWATFIPAIKHPQTELEVILGWELLVKESPIPTVIGDPSATVPITSIPTPPNIKTIFSVSDL